MWRNFMVNTGRQKETKQQLGHLLYRGQTTIQFTDADLEYSLLKQIQEESTEAQQKLLVMHRMYIYQCAKSYHTEHLSAEELITEGSMGLLRAAQKFDIAKKCKFITYASHWIHAYMRNAIYNTDFCIRLPMNKWAMIKRTECLSEYKLSRYGDKADHTTFLSDEDQKEHAKITAAHEQYTNLLSTQSLDTGENNKAYLYESISYENDSIPDDLLVVKEAVQHLHDIMNAVLSRREIDILTLYYGLSDTCAYTFAEIGVMFDRSKERVRQIVHTSIKKLKKAFKQEGCFA